jgi:hypothetical protein
MVYNKLVIISFDVQNALIWLLRAPLSCLLWMYPYHSLRIFLLSYIPGCFGLFLSFPFLKSAFSLRKLMPFHKEWNLESKNKDP